MPGAVPFSGAVLAGGRSRRMGQDKAFVEVDGVPMVRRVVAALGQAGAADIRVTGGDRERLEALGLDVDPDTEPHAGPLAALVASLGQSRHEVVFVLACDLPWISAEAVTTVLEALGDADAAVPVAENRRQWLHGAWRRSCLSRLRSSYREGERSIHRAVGDLNISVVQGISPAVLADADRPGDLVGSPYPEAMRISEIGIDELARRHPQGVSLMDVRQPREYDKAHVPGAVLIPLDQLPERLSEVPSGDLLVICGSGGRSAKAVEFLASQGREATNVAGGTKGWMEAGHPVTGGAESA